MCAFCEQERHSGYHLCFTSLSFREGWTTLAQLRASNEGLPRPRVARAKSRGCPAFSHPPRSTDLNIRPIHVPCFVAEEIAHGSHGVVYGSNVAGGNAFGHAGELSRRRAA